MASKSANTEGKSLLTLALPLIIEHVIINILCYKTIGRTVLKLNLQQQINIAEKTLCKSQGCTGTGYSDHMIQCV